MEWIEVFKAFVLGIVEGITEWLPVSSTGHMILANEFLRLNVGENAGQFREMFLVVIQLGAVLAVVVLFWNTLFPFSLKKNENEGSIVRMDTIKMWIKIIVASLPAAVIGLLWDDEIDELFYNYPTVAIALIVVGILFIVIENINAKKQPRMDVIKGITYKDAVIIGLFQLIAAVFPGTSRSGATIIGAMIIGISRGAATEFTFFLAIPAMFGASLLKMLKFGFAFTPFELVVLLTGMVVAFVLSILIIRFLTGYVKKHDFKVFGWYRIILGEIVLLYFLI